jgi:hypothetical protein
MSDADEGWTMKDGLLMSMKLEVAECEQHFVRAPSLVLAANMVRTFTCSHGAAVP